MAGRGQPCKITGQRPIALDHPDASNIGTRQAPVERGDLPPLPEGSDRDGVTDEPGTAKDQQAHVNIVPA
jgi:hypothetical protein